MLNYAARYQRVLEEFDEQKIDAFLVSNPLNIRYLTGLCLTDGELVFSPLENSLFVDSRYLLEAQQHKFDFDVKVLQFKDKFKEISVWLNDHDFRAIGVESCYLSHHNFLRWQEKISGRLILCESLIEKLRIRKDNFEIELIQKAIGILANIIKKIPDLLRNGIGLSEKEVCLEIEYLIKKEGAERLAFEIIVASGERSAMPHAAPTGRKIKEGEIVLIDMGAVYEGYHSDVTRIFCLGEKKGQLEHILSILQSAQTAAIKHIKPGVSAKDIDACARNVIEQAGYGSCFGHGTGHGVGIEVHEGPWISPGNENILEEGMVFTLEPGIYLPNQFGLRLEDMVAVGQQGPVVLSRSIPQEITWI